MVVAGLIAGYVMALAGLWAGRVPGLAAIDIADFGRRYMVSDRSSAWLIGLGSHLVNSILLVFLWASTVEVNLAWARWLEGAAFGTLLALVLAGALVAPMAGLGFIEHARHPTLEIREGAPSGAPSAPLWGSPA